MINFTGVNTAKVVEQCKSTLINLGANGALINKTSSDSFTSHNLLHFLKKKLRTVDEIANFIQRLSEDEKYIGCLPGGWREKINIYDMKSSTLEIQKILSDFAAKSRTGKDTPIEKFDLQIKELERKLKSFFGECKVEHIGKGCFGRVFRIQCAGEDLALKIFHESPLQKTSYGFGQVKEIANAVHMNYTLKPNQCSRFYCAKAGDRNSKDVYILTDFLESDGKSHIYRSKKPWSYSRFCYSDYKEENIINGKMIDFGGIFDTYRNPNVSAFEKELYSYIVSGNLEGISKMQKKYRDDSGFNAIISGIKKSVERRLSELSYFTKTDSVYTKKELEACKALGVDLSRKSFLSWCFDSIKGFLIPKTQRK